VDGDQQIGAVAAALTKQLVVKVIDANGLPVEGATVTFNVRGGGGSVNPPANTSSQSGLVSATWTLGTALGANKVVAILTNNYVLDSVVFTATATAGAPRVITITGGNNQISNVGRALPIPLAIKLADQFGFPISGVRVTWTAGAQSGTVVPVRDTSSADGSASANWTLGTNASVTQTVTASAPGLTPIVFTVTTKADTGRVINLTRGNNQRGNVSAALTDSITVKVTDQYGNPIVGDTVTFGDLLSSGGKVGTKLVATAADGSASSVWTLGGIAGAQVQRIKYTIGSQTTTLNINATATLQFSEVTAGNFHVCGVVANSQNAYCWGAGDQGQLGKGTLISATQPSAPVTIGPDTVNGPWLSIRQMTSGRNAYCGLTVARLMYCWGRYIGTTSLSSATVEAIVDGGTNQQILPNFISLGQEHQCVLDLAGAQYCTGFNRHGQLGDSTFVSTPVNTYSITYLPATKNRLSFTAAGTNHSCAIRRYNPSGTGVPADSIASRTPICWGQGTSGQLGNGFFADSAIPRPIQMPAGVTGFDSATVAAGDQHSCAIASSPAAKLGQTYCWGNNAFGQLGTGTGGTAASRDSIAQPVSQGGVAYVRLYAGEYHTCAIASTGDAYCWGRNDYAQLGNGTRSNQSAPVLVQGGLKFRSLSIGELFTCGIVAPLGTPGVQSSQPGVMYCWGDNVFGQLGQGTAVNNAPSLTPTKVLNQP
jgi:alpha-tubulin suppressor-like RCC1 family protein